ncbi:hypothetical protein [Halalkalibacter alkalisediminis]|uniref:S1 motif domain-containing protein n=1 Tax=Halalkalibacter alkalisediminis TaxID=935616 RepID=A0ABV6NGV9_9BACI|nr:hypothetical protein [Halalkalibacter alkalisediminis]
MLLALKISNMLSCLLPHRSTKPTYINGLPVSEPDLVGEVLSVEEHGLFIDGKVYLDIRDATIMDEQNIRLEVKDIDEGDTVRIWISESELFGMTPALGTAMFVQRENK